MRSTYLAGQHRWSLPTAAAAVVAGVVEIGWRSPSRLKECRQLHHRQCDRIFDHIQLQRTPRPHCNKGEQLPHPPSPSPPNNPHDTFRKLPQSDPAPRPQQPLSPKGIVTVMKSRCMRLPCLVDHRRERVANLAAHRPIQGQHQVLHLTSLKILTRAKYRAMTTFNNKLDGSQDVANRVVVHGLCLEESDGRSRLSRPVVHGSFVCICVCGGFALSTGATRSSSFFLHAPSPTHLGILFDSSPAAAAAAACCCCCCCFFGMHCRRIDGIVLGANSSIDCERAALPSFVHHRSSASADTIRWV